jgi:hypothetical protein
MDINEMWWRDGRFYHQSTKYKILENFLSQGPSGALKKQEILADLLMRTLQAVEATNWLAASSNRAFFLSRSTISGCLGFKDFNFLKRMSVSILPTSSIGGNVTHWMVVVTSEGGVSNRALMTIEFANAFSLSESCGR